MDTILLTEGLTKRFGSLTAVDDVSFELKRGNVYGILGPNGSGKSTTLGMVLNVVNPTSGTFQWFDGSQSHHEALKRIGAIIERPNFYPNMSAEANLKLVCKIKEVDERQIDKKLDLVGLLSRKRHSFKTFSLGMKQRLAIASALLNEPEILILDEPTNGLDPQGIRQMRDLIIQIAEGGTTILLASHLLDEVEKVCSHVIVLRKGKMLYSGSVQAMSATHGSLIVSAEDQTRLREFLEKHPAIASVNLEQGRINAVLSHEISAGALNKSAMEAGIVLNHLAVATESLEDKFIHLTDNN